ncbi:hypothetical protein [Devosia aurantiaca]|uniref:Uncharacterized protein n=1 Tax=Devosia aurantiaca TaxID=2714858 RepID=A0A6M1SAC0_9HYPH|nr:hypothetical protein [Devosia aurantiaca]NGP16919.1 hypothetical protein [Devosia aurantiaca]
MPFVKSVLPVLAAMALVSPALAQTMPVTVEGNNLVLEAQAQKLSLPKPDWIDQAAENWTDLVSTRFTEIGDQAHLEIYPRGEGEAFWTTHYGARLTRSANPVLTEFRSAVMDVYARSCRPEATAFSSSNPTTATIFPARLCVRSLSRPGRCRAGRGDDHQLLQVGKRRGHGLPGLARRRLRRSRYQHMAGEPGRCRTARFALQDRGGAQPCGLTRGS